MIAEATLKKRNLGFLNPPQAIALKAIACGGPLYTRKNANENTN